MAQQRCAPAASVLDAIHRAKAPMAQVIKYSLWRISVFAKNERLTCSKEHAFVWTSLEARFTLNAPRVASLFESVRAVSQAMTQCAFPRSVAQRMRNARRIHVMTQA